jgi:ABC transporter, permease protein
MAKHGWVFISPLLIGFAVFYLEILVRSALFSFQDVTPGDTSFQTAWVGLRHYYTALFVDTTYLRNLVNATVQLLYNVPLVIIFSLFVATLLNQKLRGSAVFRAIFFIPAVLVTGAIAASTSGNALSAAMNELEGISTGAGASGAFTMEDLQNLFGGAVMSSSLYTYILSIINNIFGVINQCGVQILIFIAGLQSISPSVYEAASIEGANGWDCYWKITFPLIGPMIYVNAIYTVVDSFTGSSNPIMKEVYSLGISQSKIGYASAYAWMYFAVIVLVLLAVTALMKLTMLRKTKG